MPWSTDKVLETTVSIATENQLTISVNLPSLSDVDTPNDLGVWEHEKQVTIERSLALPKISIIIPGEWLGVTFN